MQLCSQMDVDVADRQVSKEKHVFVNMSFNTWVDGRQEVWDRASFFCLWIIWFAATSTVTLIYCSNYLRVAEPFLVTI